MKPASAGFLGEHTNLMFLSTGMREGQAEVQCFETFKKFAEKMAQRFLSFLA